MEKLHMPAVKASKIACGDFDEIFVSIENFRFIISIKFSVSIHIA